MTADHPTREERYAAVLAEHDWLTPRGYAWPCCTCGVEFPEGEEAAYAHVAAALVAADPAPAQPVPAPEVSRGGVAKGGFSGQRVTIHLDDRECIIGPNLRCQRTDEAHMPHHALPTDDGADCCRERTTAGDCGCGGES